MSNQLTKKAATMLLALSFYFISSAQFQRIGVMAGEIISMDALSSTATVSSYCMDLFKRSPSDFAGLAKPNYSKILTPNSVRVTVEGIQGNLTLRQAIDRGFLKYVIDEYNEVKFIRGPNAKKRIDVEFIADGFFGNGTDVPPTKPIPKLADPAAERYFGSLVKQDVIWGEETPSDVSVIVKGIQQFLKKIDMFDGAINGNVAETVEAIKAFNRKMNLPESSPWNPKYTGAFYDFLDKADYYKEPKSIPGYLYTDELGVSHFLGKTDNTSLLAIKAKADGNKLKLVDFGLPQQRVFTDYEKAFAARISKTGDERITPVYVSSIEGNQISVTIGNETSTLNFTSEDQYGELVSHLNEKINSKGLTQVTLVADELKKVSWGEGKFTEKIGQKNNRGYVNLTRLANDITTAHKELDVFITADPEGYLDRIKSLPTPSSREDLTLVLQKNPLDPLDRIPIDQLSRIRANGLDYQFIDDGYFGLEVEGDVAVFMGNNGKEFYDVLSSASYDLQGKVIIAFTCHTPNDIANYAQLIQRHGIKGIVFYPYLIDPGAVRMVLQRLGKALDPNMPPTQIRKIIQKAVDKTLEESKLQPPRILNEIRKLRDPGIQVFQYKINHQSIFLS